MIPRQRVAVKYEVAAHAPGGELFKRFMLLLKRALFGHDEARRPGLTAACRPCPADPPESARVCPDLREPAPVRRARRGSQREIFPSRRIRRDMAAVMRRSVIKVNVQIPMSA